MDRIAARSLLRCADLRSTIASRLALNLNGVRSNFSTTQSSCRQRPRAKSQERASKTEANQYERQSILQHITPEILRLRQVTHTINQDLSAPSEDLRAWVEEFLRLGSLQLLKSNDCSEVVRTLHNLDRKYRKEKNGDSQKVVYELAERVRRAYVSGSLPSSSHVPLHLLSYYKESGHLDEGLEFWKWLSAEEAKLDPVYAGAAIELLAVYGAGIRYCEHIYERTLVQQEGIGSQYHLSPGAILPDRSKAVTISGTSLGLLQGILSARLFYGKWQRSYLTLDTAFMLRPTQMVPRFLDLFVYERPIFEALPVFFMYCRGGNAVSGVTLMAILNSLKNLANRVSHHTEQVQLIQAIFCVVEAYVGSAGQLNSQHLNVLTNAFVSAMPPKPAATPTELTKGDNDVTDMVVDFFAKLFRYSVRHNASPNSITFGEIISKALSLGYADLAKVAFQDMLSLNISPSEPTAVSVIKAAALLNDPDLLKTGWACVRNASLSKSRKAPDKPSWISLAAAAGSCGLHSFVEDEFQALAPELLSHARSTVQSMEKEPSLPIEVKPEGLDLKHVNAFRHLCAEVSLTLDRMESVPGTGYRDLHKYPVDEPPMFKWPEIAEEMWQRKLYNELTLEDSAKGSQPTSVENADGLQDATSDISNTGVPFDDLRYLNWKTINNLLIQAEAWEQRTEASTDAAIREQRASPRARESTSSSGATAIRYPVTVQQLEDYQQDVGNERATFMTEEEWRKRILRLRSPDYEDQAHTTE